MAKQAADFITNLSRDPKLRASFKKDPDGTMDAHGLSAQDKEVLKSGDPEKIRTHLGDDGPPGCCIMLFV